MRVAFILDDLRLFAKSTDIADIRAVTCFRRQDCRGNFFEIFGVESACVCFDNPNLLNAVSRPQPRILMKRISVLVFALIAGFELQGCSWSRRELSFTENDPLVGTWIEENFSATPKTFAVDKEGRIESKDFPLYLCFLTENDFPGLGLYALLADDPAMPSQCVKRVESGEPHEVVLIVNSLVDQYRALAALEKDGRFFILEEQPHSRDPAYIKTIAGALRDGRSVEDLAAEGGVKIRYVFRKTNPGASR